MEATDNDNSDQSSEDDCFSYTYCSDEDGDTFQDQKHSASMYSFKDHTTNSKDSARHPHSDCTSEQNERFRRLPRTVDRNYILKVLPLDILKIPFTMLPPSNRLVAPVCRAFRDCHAAAAGEKKRYCTFKYSLRSESALASYLDEAGVRSSGYVKEKTTLIGAGAGRIDWVQRGSAFDEGECLTAETCKVAAACGQMRTLKWLKSRKCPWNSGVCTAAARHGHLEILKWAREQGCPFGFLGQGTAGAAARGGHLKVLMWLKDHGCPPTVNAMYCAATGGHLHVLRWLTGRGLRCDEGVGRAAVGGEHLHILKWLKEGGHTFHPGYCGEAAKLGHLGMLQWLRRAGCPWDLSTCNGASEGGHIHILRWAREQGCACNADMYQYAAQNRHYEFIRWAVEHGCPYDAHLVDFVHDQATDPEFRAWFQEHEGVRGVVIPP